VAQILKGPSRSSVARRPGSVAATSTETRLQAFSDLEVPVKALLTFDEEARCGLKIQNLLRRLGRLLPLHPEAYRRFLARMQGVMNGGEPMFSWYPLADRMEGDLEVVTQALRRAECLAATSPSRGLRLYRDGVQVLKEYPLDPETLFQWSREVAGNLRPSRSLDSTEEARRVDRVLKKITQALETHRDRLILPNFRLVLKEVFRYRPVGMKRSDLFQEGIIGLHKAVFRFDATRGIRFSTYATYWIRQAIRKCLTDKARLIRVPQAIQEELRKADCSLEEAEAERLRRLMKETALFSYGESEDSTDRFCFEVRDRSMPEFNEPLRLHRLPQTVQEALESLSSRQRDVLQRRFGLSGERPQTLEEIGVLLNLSRERIRQIEQEAMASLRKSKGLWEAYEDLDRASVTTAQARN